MSDTKKNSSIISLSKYRQKKEEREREQKKASSSDISFSGEKRGDIIFMSKYLKSKENPNPRDASDSAESPRARQSQKAQKNNLIYLDNYRKKKRPWKKSLASYSQGMLQVGAMSCVFMLCFSLFQNIKSPSPSAGFPGAPLSAELKYKTEDSKISPLSPQSLGERRGLASARLEGEPPLEEKGYQEILKAKKNIILAKPLPPSSKYRGF